MTLGADRDAPVHAAGAGSGYASHVLPALLILGLGMGCIFAPAFGTATLGVEGAEAGVASAMVNTSQQVGGSVGTALLSTLFASAAASYAVEPPALAADLADAAASTATRPPSVVGRDLRRRPAAGAGGAALENVRSPAPEPQDATDAVGGDRRSSRRRGGGKSGRPSRRTPGSPSSPGRAVTSSSSGSGRCVFAARWTRRSMERARHAVKRCRRSRRRQRMTAVGEIAL